MPFPPYGTSVPSLNPYEFSFAGQKFGSLTVPSTYQLQNVQGLDLPPIIGGDVARALTSGSFRGIDVSGVRTITVQFVIGTASASALDTARLNLSAVFFAAGNTEQPLFFKSGGGTVYSCMARVMKYAAPVDLNNVQAHACVVTVAFKCTDWRIYGAPTQHATNTFNYVSQSVSCVVGGLTYVNPIIVITAGANGCVPYIYDNSEVIINLLWSGLTMLAGDTLVIDTDFQTATWTSGGVATSALPLLWYPATWGPLPAGTTTVINALDTQSGSPANSTLEVQWANAFGSI